MEKYLITGEIISWRKYYALFSTGEYFILDIKRLKTITNPTKSDLAVIRTLNNEDFREKLGNARDNYYFSAEFKDEDGNDMSISNIKYYRDPTLISYEYEHCRSLYISNKKKTVNRISVE
ncbi:MAG: hypothetical protein BZ136_01255 [Methanosphaera sp. rholeuAM74]|nr:MAG: hypothetical protein BZ136_01255 [Methanosphaera sp. rholeuAM74]